MKRTWIAGLVMGMGVVAWSVQAADAEAGKGLTAEQQRQRSALIQKYDLNGDRMLDQSEAKKMTKADRNALAKVGGIGAAKKSAKTEKAEAVEKAAKGKKAEKSAKAKVEKGGKEREKTGSDAVKAAKGKGKE